MRHGLKVILGFALAVSAGCERATVQRDQPSRVGGMVTIDGKPLPFGTVTFYPEPPEAAGLHPAIAAIGPDGRYDLGNAPGERWRGQKPGRYRVAVLAMRPRPPGGGVARLASPAQYADARRSPIVVDLAEGEATINLALSSEATAR